MGSSPTSVLVVDDEPVVCSLIRDCLQASVRHHHENWDGSGYPDGLAAEEIPIGSRIISVADAMDTMLMKRNYKQALSVEGMIAELRRCSGTQFDPVLAASAIDWIRSHPTDIIEPDEDGAESPPVSVPVEQAGGLGLPIRP